MVVLALTGCVGKNGGGLNHYVGQEKLAPMAPWSFIAFGRDWASPPRLMNAPSWHYVHSDQWRYEADFTEYHTVPGEARLAQGHTIDLNLKAVRSGWLGHVFEVHTVMSKKVDERTRRALAKYPGGSMFELGCHVIDAVVTLLGEPDRVTPFNRQTHPERDDLLDNCLAVFEYPRATATVRSALSK